MNYEVHPAALLFPMMGQDELGKLADDIAANGLMEPVVLYHGQILDGRNRLAACTLADVEPRFVEVDGNLPSATVYVISRNLHRRHLTTSQRGAIAAEVVPLLQQEAAQRRNEHLKRGDKSPLTPIGVNGAKGSSVEIAAKAADVGAGTVQRALDVKRHDPALFEKIKAGKVTAYEARRTIDESHVPKDERKYDGKGKPLPYETKTARQKQLAEGQKERMIRALSTITGLCRGLGEMDVRKAVAACYEEERAEWVERAKDLSTQLRAFAGKLQKGF